MTRIKDTHTEEEHGDDRHENGGMYQDEIQSLA